jgi:tRNA-modifying protein YgfZ
MTDFSHPWLQFLTTQGAHIDAGQVSGFDGVDGSAAADGFVVPLIELGLIEATGADAAAFLHNQLTNDIEHLDTTEARLAGYCSPKGRLLATFLTWRTGDSILLQLPRELQAPIQKRLQMYVLRSKAKLNDVSLQYAAIGLGGAAAGATLSALFPEKPDAPLAKVDTASGTLIRTADAFNAPRYLWIAPLDVAQKAWPDLSRHLTAVGADVWRLAEIEAGIPQITVATQEKFVPQMVNLELIGGVSFKKGCYPGQEIVARSQYLGKLKRRMLPATLDAEDIAPGMEVYSSADPAQPCGTVVNAAQTGSGGSRALVEIKLSASEGGTVHLGSATGPRLQFGTLPYTLPS